MKTRARDEPKRWPSLLLTGVVVARVVVAAAVVVEPTSSG